MSGIIGKNVNRSSGVIGTEAVSSDLVNDTSPQLGGFLDANGNYIQMEKGGDISSASPTVIDTDGDYFDVTGTTDFSAFTVAADRHFFVQFDGVLTMTHHATNLDLPGGANITTAAGDVGEFFATGTNTVQCVNYTKADGTAVVAAAGGDIINFVIDGDFTQWPEGTSAVALAGGSYYSALMTASAGHDGTATAERSTDVPTIAQSGHKSLYSILYKCTGTDVSIGSTQKLYIEYFMTGSDFIHLHEQQVTFSFWCKTAAANSGDTYYFSLKNSAVNVSYVKSFAPTSSWVEYTFTVSMATVGTWLFTEADRGLRIQIHLIAGSALGDGTDGAWVESQEHFDSGATAISNFLDSTSNELYISQLGAYLGPTAPTFTSPPIATIKDQVAYYIERYDFTTNNAEVWQEGGVENTGQMRAMVRYREKRIAPPTITSTAAGTFDGWDFSSDVNGNSIAFDAIHTRHARVKLGQAGTSWTVGQNSAISRDGTDTCNVTYDARH